jgi:hypothetical protein
VGKRQATSQLIRMNDGVDVHLRVPPSGCHYTLPQQRQPHDTPYCATHIIVLREVTSILAGMKAKIRLGKLEM